LFDNEKNVELMNKLLKTMLIKSHKPSFVSKIRK